MRTSSVARGRLALPGSPFLGLRACLIAADLDEVSAPRRKQVDEAFDLRDAATLGRNRRISHDADDAVRPARGEAGKLQSPLCLVLSWI